MSRIAGVEVFPLAAPIDASGDLDGSADTLVVRITDEAGRGGIGECDAPASVVRAYLEIPTAHLWSQNMPRLMVGQDPLELVALWERLYEATQDQGRRGLGVHALSAID